MAHKNDYSCIVFFQDGKPKKWNYVHKLDGFVKFLNQKHQGWKYLNVYERRSGSYLRRFYPGNLIPGFLTFLLVTFSAFLLTFSKPTKPLNSTFNKTTFSNLTFINGFNNSATIPTLSKEKKDVVC
jgi:hypothetical protein